MTTGETLARYGEAVAVGSELCDALFEAASGREFVGATRGSRDSMISWAFNAGGQTVTVVKHGNSFDPEANQRSLSASDGTQIIVTGESMSGLDQVFDTRDQPLGLRIPGAKESSPSDFSKAFDTRVPVGVGGLTLGILLDNAVELNARELGEHMAEHVPEAEYTAKHSVHFGDTTEGLEEFSVTAVKREAVLGDGRYVESRAFTMLLPSDDPEEPDGLLVFDTFDPTISVAGMGPVPGDLLLSIRGCLFGNSNERDRKQDALLTRGESQIPQTIEELGRIHDIGRTILRYVNGYVAGYAMRFEASDPSSHPDKMYARGYDTGATLWTSNRQSARYLLALSGNPRARRIRLLHQI